MAAKTPHLQKPASLLDKPQIDACLDDLLASRFLTTSCAERVRSSRDLPSALERCVNNLGSELVWRAYGDADRMLFAIALAHAATEQNAVLAIDVYFLDRSAAVYCAGVWAYDRTHGWWLDAVLDLSYDYEHGWWIATLMPKTATASTVIPAVQLAATAEPQLAFRARR
jgi:glycosyltransferase A (GT-A) superfamily protein (DUF2064 family)